MSLATVLADRTVVLCRAPDQANDLAAALGSLGATVLLLPLVAVVPIVGQGLGRAIDSLESYTWVACTSKNSARMVVDGRGLRPWPARTKVAVVGSATAQPFIDAGIPVSLVATQATAAALAQDLGKLAQSSDQPQQILAPLGELAGSDLVDGLLAHGLSVNAVVAYRSVMPPVSPQSVADAAEADAILLTSGSIADRLLGLFADAGLQTEAALICIGPQTASALEKGGAKATEVANPHTAMGLIEATVRTIGA